MGDTISVIYFSGTGGSKRIAEAFEYELQKRSYKTNTISLDFPRQRSDGLDRRYSFEDSKCVILVFAVHAFDAPEPVYQWLNNAKGSGIKTAVISVSGGGDVWPNTGCRHKLNRILEQKGFIVEYEKMMVMPCNWVVSTNDHLSMWLISSIPIKVEKILNGILSGNKRRVRHRLGLFRKVIRYLEKLGSKQFGSNIIVNENCTGCGWCERNCPTINISLLDNRPVFSDKCVMCFRCIYGCPQKVMTSKSFMVLKQGFSLKELEQRMKDVRLRPIEECCKGILWMGVKRYLNDKDGY